MIHSMTGYASLERSSEQGMIQIELRSVNQRFLELHLKLDERCRMLETSVRNQLKRHLGRGKVECRINVIPTTPYQTAVTVNQDALKAWATAIESAKAYFPDAQPVNIVDTLKLPNVMVDTPSLATMQEDEVMSALDACIMSLVEARASEGEKLKVFILERLSDLKGQVDIVKPLMPGLLTAYQTKLMDMLNEAIGAADDERVRQELLLFAQKIDVDEELSRLDAHIGEVQTILQAGGLVGKRLDFLMQEMNREANTLGSKSVSIETTQVSMQLKVFIEQMREQIQNIE